MIKADILITCVAHGYTIYRVTVKTRGKFQKTYKSVLKLVKKNFNYVVQYFNTKKIS